LNSFDPDMFNLVNAAATLQRGDDVFKIKAGKVVATNPVQ